MNDVNKYKEHIMNRLNNLYGNVENTKISEINMIIPKYDKNTTYSKEPSNYSKFLNKGPNPHKKNIRKTNSNLTNYNMHSFIHTFKQMQGTFLSNYHSSPNKKSQISPLKMLNFSNYDSLKYHSPLNKLNKTYNNRIE